MLPTIISQINNLSLNEVIARLAESKVVDGVLIIGSASNNELTPASDYDLIVVLSEMPVPLRSGLTYINRRLTDILFISTATIERVLPSDKLAAHVSDDEARLLRWLQTGQIAFDPSGHIQRAQDKAKTWQETNASESEIYSAWFRINYDLKQTRRMLSSDDPAYLMAVDLRLLFSLHDLWRCYFRFRGLTHQGEKAQARYLTTYDPAYLELFRQCLAETNRERKVQLYERLAQLTVAPIGNIWEEGATNILPEPDAEWKAGTLQSALSFWESLVEHPAG